MGKETIRRQKLDPSFPVKINLGPLKFGIPWKYLHPRPFTTHLNCDPNRKAVGIQFWIPSLDAPERDLWFRPEYTPSETNRPVPAAGEHVIKVNEIKYYGPGYPFEGTLADRRIENTLQLYQRDGFRLVKDYGLTKIEPQTWTAENVEWFERNETESLLIHCASRLCQGFLDLKDMKLTARFAVERTAVIQHQTIVDGMRRLLTQWKIAP